MSSARPADFTALNGEHPHYEDISAVLGLGLMNGVSEDRFGVELPATYGMAVTTLHRLNGSTSPTDPWYQGGMDWAVERGLSDGTESQNTALTLEQMVIALWKYMERPHRTAPLDQWYTDAGLLSEEGRAALCWAVNDGILSVSGTTLNPLSVADRAQLAAAVHQIWKLKNTVQNVGGSLSGSVVACTCIYHCSSSSCLAAAYDVDHTSTPSSCPVCNNP